MKTNRKPTQRQPEVWMTVRLANNTTDYASMKTEDAVKPNGMIDELNKRFGEGGWVVFEWEYYTPFSAKPKDFGGVFHSSALKAQND